MAPRSFASDGAAGAADNGVTSGADPLGAGANTSASDTAAAPTFTPPPSQGGAGPQVGVQQMTTPVAPPTQAANNTNFAPTFAPQGGAPSSVGSVGNDLPGISWGFDDGGSIDDTNGSPRQNDISQALDTVDGVLAYGRKLHGLGGDDSDSGGAIQTAGNMPSVPSSQSESGIRQPQPMPGPLPPTNNPFGKRGPMQMSANMPSAPSSQSESGIKPQQPMPGPLPPTNNPFGQRRGPMQMSSNDDNGQNGDGAIDTEDA